MKHRFFWRTAILATSWLGLNSLVASAQPVVWVTPSLQRTTQTDPAGSGALAQISAGKGEYESFQIVVRGPASGLTNVNVAVSNLIGPGGAVIPSTNFTLFSEHYVYVSTSSPNWGGTNQPLGAGWYPDGLVPFNDPNTGAPLSGSGAALVAVPFNLNPNVNQGIWVDLLVPRSAVAGQYSGTFTVSSNQGNTTGTISLTVWNFTLPLKSTLKSTFLYWNTSGLASDEELLRNKLEPLREAASEQSTLMSGYGLGDIGLPFWSGADVSNCSMSAAPSTSQLQASVASQTAGLSSYIYSADEIGNCPSLFPTMQQWAYNMHQSGVNNLVTMAPTQALFSDGSGTGRSAVDIWTMLPVTYNGATSLVAQALAKGDSAWSYNTLVQDSYSPKWEIDFAPINYRIQPGFISQSLGLTGLLYWKVDGWNTADPWNQVNNAGLYSSNNYPGEATLVYPGTQVGISGVAPSMRLKWLRDGVEDFEYVAMLKALGQGSQALSLAQSVGPDWTNWTRNTTLLASVRQQLGQLLDQLSGGSPPPTVPPKPVNPSPASGATGVSLNPTLSWSASSGATSYDIYFGTTSTTLVATVTGTTYAPGTLLPNTTYNWGIVAKNSAGSNSSAGWTFTTGSAAPPPPNAPANPNPASGTSGVSSSLTLTWSASANATSYDVYFGSSPSPAFVMNTAGASYAPAGLTGGTTYYWQIIAKNSAGTASSAVWSFSTASGISVPPKPVNPSPATGATGVSLNPVLSWGAATGATSYDVYFGTTSTSLVATVTGTTYSPGTLAANTVYNWGVVAKNSAGSNSSAGWTFTTGAAAVPLPAAPANPNPASGATGVNLTPTLSWGAAANATSYDVYFGQSSPAFVTNTTGTSYTPGALTSSSTYSWLVVAKNSSGSATSATWTFTTSAPGPVTPTEVSASPSSGSGKIETLVLTFGDGNGFTDIAGAGAMINSSQNGTNACWFYYDRSSNSLSLASDSTANWTPVPTGGSVSNSQCTISSVSATGFGTTFSLKLVITYNRTFAGTRNVYGYVQSMGGRSPGYQLLGSWIVPNR
jgi:hypothetical protein